MHSNQNSSPSLSWIIIRGMIIVLLVSAAFPAAASNTSPGNGLIWYVAPGGDDGSSCQDTGEPCATINAAIGKASAGDTIRVGAGTYTPNLGSPASEVVLIDKDVNLVGGWDASFESQSGVSVIDGDESRRGITINVGVATWLDGFTVQDGYNGGVRNMGTISMTNVIISHNQYQGISNSGTLTLTESLVTDNYWDGIASDGTLFVANSTISDNRACGGCGGAILSYGTATIQNSTISHNANWGVKSTSSNPVTVINSTLDHNSGYGVDIYAGNVVVVNSTISSNTRGGGYVENNGNLRLYSSTVSYNGNLDPTSVGGGIRVGWGTAHFVNTILARNIATTGPDCYKIAGSLVSDGYNLIGNTSSCSYTPGTGDMTNIGPQLAPLQDNGGPTRTHGLFLASPAINAGDPLGCTDHLENPLTADQRGFPRSDRCDIGAYERQPGSGPAQVFLPCLTTPCAPVYFDDFSNPDSGWPIIEDENYKTEYVENEYRILVKTPQRLLGALPDFQATDFIIQVDVRNVGAVAGAYGILFGFNDLRTQFYSFEITSSGDFLIWKFDAGTQPPTWTLLAAGTSADIVPGTATNQIKLRRNGTEISTYANGELLTSIDDGSYMGSRYLGVIARSIDSPNLDVRFDNFGVYPVNCLTGTSYTTERDASNLVGSGFYFDVDLVGSRK